MSSTEHEAFIRKLDELDRRLEDRQREFRSRGEFAKVHESFVHALTDRQADLRRKVTAKLKEGLSWDLLKTEFERDFNGLSGELSRWEEHVDAAEMAKRSR
jgi:hypothetical protein